MKFKVGHIKNFDCERVVMVRNLTYFQAEAGDEKDCPTMQPSKSSAGVSLRDEVNRRTPSCAGNEACK